MSRLKKRHLKERYGPYCHYCGKDDDELTLDHIIPRSLGGARVVINLVLACYDCNQERQDTPYLEFAAIKGIDLKVANKILDDAVDAHYYVHGFYFYKYSGDTIYPEVVQLSLENAKKYNTPTTYYGYKT